MDISILINPVVTSALQWLVVAMLGGLSARLVRLGHLINDTQKATKVLMREDLIDRWLYAKRIGCMSDAAKREWADDYALYLRLVGRNDYLEDISNRLLEIPSRADE